MSYLADLHIHSRFSRATSPELTFAQLHAWGRRKGIALIGSGDCTHPGWLAEMKEQLEPAGDGLYRLRRAYHPRTRLLPGTQQPVRFLISGEISTIYKAGGATRKVHHLICLPGLAEAERFSERLSRVGNITADGRPILGLDSRDLLEMLLSVSEEAVLIPAHIWTPWFSVLGSKSGFDSIEECYRDLTGHIFAVETGLSSDPPMNWRVSSLDRYALVSNSDAHSASKLGREANIFSGSMGYRAMMNALKRTAPGFRGTLEFFPQEGKYHADGHRKCRFSCPPHESKALGGVCPVCGGALTLGVDYRVEELADRQRGKKPPAARPFQRLLSLAAILGEVLQCSPASKKVQAAYDELLGALGPELRILRETDIEELREHGGDLLARGIDKMRAGTVHASAGYDGEYGEITLFTAEERAEIIGQSRLFAGLAFSASSSPALAPASQVSLFPELPASPLAEGLSAEQHAAVTHPPAPLLITAGPGAGKTRTLIERIVWLLESTPATPQSIIALTFSNRAASEMRERLRERLPALPADDTPLACTFHKLGLLIINEQRARLQLPAPLTVLSEEDADTLYAETMAEDAARACATRDDMESALADEFAGKDGVPDELAALRTRLASLAPAYTARKLQEGLLDFDDLLLLPLALLSEDAVLLGDYRRRWQHLLVDEYQDINVWQYLLLRLLCPPGGSLTAIGDPDQAIYGFRGADVRYFLRFLQDYPTAGEVALTRNYRSCHAIVKASSQLIARGRSRAERTPWSDIPGPARIGLARLSSHAAEAEYVLQTMEGLLGGISHFSVDSGRAGEETGTLLGFDDIAVLYRTHSAGEAMCEALTRSGIPFQRASRAELYQHPQVRKVLAFLQLAVTPARPSSARALLNAGLPGLTAAARQRMLKILAQWRPWREPILDRLARKMPKNAALARLRDSQAMLRAAGGLSLIQSLFYACNFFAMSEEEIDSEPWPTLFMRARQSASLAELLETIAQEGDEDIYQQRAARVTLSTVHAAKGLEWEVVFLIGCEDGAFPHPASPLDEERRLFYVGMTRARRCLYLSAAATRAMHNGERHEQALSPFLHDISEELLYTRQAPRVKRPAKYAQLTIDW